MHPFGLVSCIVQPDFSNCPGMSMSTLTQTQLALYSTSSATVRYTYGRNLKKIMSIIVAIFFQQPRTLPVVFATIYFVLFHNGFAVQYSVKVQGKESHHAEN